MNKKIIIFLFVFFIFSAGGGSAFGGNFSLASAATPQPSTKWACSDPQGQFDTKGDCEMGCRKTCTQFNTFTPLVELPGLEQMPGESLLAKYLSWLFRFALAAAAFLAVLQITIGGIQMIFGGASETARTNAKTRIQDAIWGLVLALGSVLILTTISTQFKDMKLTIPSIVVEVTKAPTYKCFLLYTVNPNWLDPTHVTKLSAQYKTLEECSNACKKETGVFLSWECRPESDVTSSCTNCEKGEIIGGTRGGGTIIKDGSENHKGEDEGKGFKLGIPSPEIEKLREMANKMTAKNTNVLIDKSEKTMKIYKDGILVSSIPINIGANDQKAEKIGGKNGDKITPVGEFTIESDKRIDMIGGVYNNNNINMGAAFLGLSAKDENGNYRGIGIHGGATETLGTTAGCIRVKNADLSAIYAALQPGTKIKIQN